MYLGVFVQGHPSPPSPSRFAHTPLDLGSRIFTSVNSGRAAKKGSVVAFFVQSRIQNPGSSTRLLAEERPGSSIRNASCKSVQAQDCPGLSPGSWILDLRCDEAETMLLKRSFDERLSIQSPSDSGPEGLQHPGCERPVSLRRVYLTGVGESGAVSRFQGWIAGWRQYPLGWTVLEAQDPQSPIGLSKSFN